MLKAPLRVSGEYQRPDDATLVREVQSPYRETTTIRGDQATIAREGRAPRRFKLTRAPELAALQASFGALLGGDRAALVSAKSAARLAADVDPNVWKPLFALATMEWFDGNIPGAIAASEAALARDENEFVLANLGTLYLCDGAFADAQQAYSRARELDPGSYVGDEFLGMAHYFLGDFEQSAILRQRAIDAVAAGEPEIHEMWGNLGDSYRQAGEHAKAVAAYLRAAEIAERDYLRGTAPISDRAARAYYYTMLESLKPGIVPPEVSRRLDEQLEGLDAEVTSATELRRLAQTWLVRGNTARARESLARATSTCRGYARFPDLLTLHTASTD